MFCTFHRLNWIFFIDRDFRTNFNNSFYGSLLNYCQYMCIVSCKITGLRWKINSNYCRPYKEGFFMGPAQLTVTTCSKWVVWVPLPHILFTRHWRQLIYWLQNNICLTIYWILAYCIISELLFQRFSLSFCLPCFAKFAFEFLSISAQHYKLS